VRRASAETVRRALPEPAQPLVEALLAQAECWGLGVHLVGGPVRDHLRGRPLRDVDLAVEPHAGHDALALVDAVAKPPWRVVAHPRFRTARLESGGLAVDVATVRAERYAHPGALPEVAPGMLEEDLRRRDFTVNALAIPLSKAARSDHPAVIDVAGGLRDLGERRLRVMHPRSFHDDPTRALRAARLAVRLEFALARGTRVALRSALRDGAFGAVSGERLRAEIEKLFADVRQGLDPARALRLLAEWHVLAAIEPGLTLPRAALGPLRRLGALLSDPPWEARVAAPALRPTMAGLMVWLAPLEASLRRAVLARLAVRGEPARRIRAFPASRDAWLRGLSRSRGRGAADAVLGRAGEEELLALAAAAPAQLRGRILRFAREDRHVMLPVDGDDLLAAGLRGPAVGRGLSRIRAAFLDRTVRTREEALALAAELAQRSRRSASSLRRRRR
jgi:tRNA nucleotidyltransferase (CCA-adding enzyme)